MEADSILTHFFFSVVYCMLIRHRVFVPTSRPVAQCRKHSAANQSMINSDYFCMFANHNIKRIACERRVLP